jgi:hypothetical protein
VAATATAVTAKRWKDRWAVEVIFDGGKALRGEGHYSHYAANISVGGEIIENLPEWWEDGRPAQLDSAEIQKIFGISSQWVRLGSD